MNFRMKLKTKKIFYFIFYNRNNIIVRLKILDDVELSHGALNAKLTTKHPKLLSRSFALDVTFTCF